MNRFIMTEAGRDHAFEIVSARIAFTGPGGTDRPCKIQVVASHRDLPQDAVLWFAPLRGVRGPTFSLREAVVESGAGFYLFDHNALEDVKLDLHLEEDHWHLELSCALLSMGSASQRLKVSADLELRDDFELKCA